jgi:hypothetical protein
VGQISAGPSEHCTSVLWSLLSLALTLAIRVGGNTMAKKWDLNIQGIVDQLNIANESLDTETDLHEFWFHLQHAQRLLNKEMKKLRTIMRHIHKESASKKQNVA